MFSQGRQLIGRYEEVHGTGDITVSMQEVYGGRNPFEILIKIKKDVKDSGPCVIQRVVVDNVAPNVVQGENIGKHGETGQMETFTQARIKNVVASFAKNKTKIEIKEFRFPTSIEDMETREVMYNSIYCFESNEYGQMLLDLSVLDKNGTKVKFQQFRRVDIIDRRYSVTTDKASRLPNQRAVKIEAKDIKPPVVNVSVGMAASSAIEAMKEENQGQDEISDSQDYLFYDLSSQAQLP